MAKFKPTTNFSHEDKYFSMDSEYTEKDFLGKKDIDSLKAQKLIVELKEEPKKEVKEDPKK
jgi:acyl carrier protein